MWEDLIQSESKGKRSATDLLWFPDTHIKMPAYVHSGDVSDGFSFWDAGRTSSCRYLALSATENQGILELQARRNSPNDSTNLDNESLRWISPYSHKPSSEATEIPNYLYDCWTAKLIGNEQASVLGAPTVDTFFWDHLGAGSTTQLALMLWSANMWMQQGKVPEFCILPVRTLFNSESAKLRAARVLLNHLMSVYGLPPTDLNMPGDGRWSGKMLAVTSTRTLSAVDPANNMVRNTISSVASLCGGADMLAVQPWNVFELGYGDKEAELLSENLYHLLIDEGRLGDVSDPFSGSYFIEALTGEMVKAGWDLFLRLKAESIASIQAILERELLPEDRTYFGAGESGPGARQVVGETLYADPEQTDPEQTDPKQTGALQPPRVFPPALVFPLVDPFDFEPRISTEEAA